MKKDNFEDICKIHFCLMVFSSQAFRRHLILYNLAQLPSWTLHQLVTREAYILAVGLSCFEYILYPHFCSLAKYSFALLLLYRRSPFSRWNKAELCPTVLG